METLLSHEQSPVAGDKARRRHPESASFPRNTSITSPSNQRSSHNLLLGLTIAGAASALLSSIFGLFHVDVFLNAYKLPLSSYSRGNFIFSIINTLNDLIGAWVVDHASATAVERSHMVGMAGCLFCVCFLTPFFRWKSQEEASWHNTFHFVFSMSLYDTLFSFMAILTGSIVTDDHNMTDQQRVQFMASGKITNLFASFAVARIGLAVFNVDNLFEFRVFLVVLAIITAVLYIVGQMLIEGGISRKALSWPRIHSKTENGGSGTSAARAAMDTDNDDELHDHGHRKLQWKKVALDFWRHKNFRAWIVMELLLEAQVTFVSFFLKTFVDQLVLVDNQSGDVGNYYSRETCDWFLAMVRPLSRVASIIAYIPIRRYGYPRLYSALFVANFLLGFLMLSLSDPQSPLSILVFLSLYSVMTGAVQASGFHLAMSDMVLEMKRMHALEGRLSEPSLAGMFMGTNALFCKPAESVLPVIAATVMERTNSSDHSLFYLLVLPPIVFSVIQFLAWKQYNLTPRRTASMRLELQSLKQQQQLNV